MTDRPTPEPRPDAAPTSPSGSGPVRPAPDRSADRRARRLAGTALAVAVVALVGWGVTTVALVAATTDDAATPVATGAPGSTGDSGPAVRSVADVAEAARPSVVTVRCAGLQGSGFAVDDGQEARDGSALVTNAHVVEACTAPASGALTVTTADGEEHPATVTGADADRDLAVLDADVDLAPLPLGDAWRRGDVVVAVGAPGGFEGTVTSGVLSYDDERELQSDAATSEGSSGGPLLRLEDGRVVGVTAGSYDDLEDAWYAVRVDLLCDGLLPSCPVGDAG
ncbi:S1C family serine protease [Frigoribacterium salinisoli]